MYRRGAFLSKKGLWNSTEVPLHLNKIHLNDHWKSNNTFLLKSLRRRTLCKLPSLLVTMPQNYKQFLTAQWIQKPGESFVVTEGTSGWSQVKLKGLQAGLVQFQPPEYFGFMIREETEKGPKGTRVFISSPPPPEHTHIFWQRASWDPLPMFKRGSRTFRATQLFSSKRSFYHEDVGQQASGRDGNTAPRQPLSPSFYLSAPARKALPFTVIS